MLCRSPGVFVADVVPFFKRDHGCCAVLQVCSLLMCRSSGVFVTDVVPFFRCAHGCCTILRVTIVLLYTIHG